MDVRELRIGNLVYYRIKDDLDERKEWLELSIISQEDLGIIDEDFHPIPLTEEWLVKFGFEKDVVFEDNELFHKNNLSVQAIKIGYDNCVLWYDNEILSNLQHVHSLQNLYFALTGEELTFKNQ